LVRVDDLLRRATAAYVDSGLADGSVADSALERVGEFFKTRVATYLKENGVAYDVVGAVSAVSWATPGLALERARAFQDSRGDVAFELLITGAKRVGNILDPKMKWFGAGWDVLEEAFMGSGSLGKGVGFNRAAFEDEAETRLADAIHKTIPLLAEFEEASDGRGILHALSELGPVIDDYFDRVLVNCPDSALRANRHHFLAAVFALFSKYADFSHIVEEGNVRVG
jgi:glycyl-tRNA synthetase beta chain